MKVFSHQMKLSTHHEEEEPEIDRCGRLEGGGNVLLALTVKLNACGSSQSTTPCATNSKTLMIISELV